jgi:hypothetical protein
MLLALTFFQCENTDSFKEAETINFRIRPIEKGKSYCSNNISYNNNLEIKREISYYNPLEEKIYLEFPISDNLFKYHSV